MKENHHYWQNYMDVTVVILNTSIAIYPGFEEILNVLQTVCLESGIFQIFVPPAGSACQSFMHPNFQF